MGSSSKANENVMIKNFIPKGWRVLSPYCKMMPGGARSIQPGAVPLFLAPITSNRIVRHDGSCHPLSEKASRLKRLCLDCKPWWTSCVLACWGLQQAQTVTDVNAFPQYSSAQAESCQVSPVLNKGLLDSAWGIDCQSKLKLNGTQLTLVAFPSFISEQTG